jgi:GDPmannose 4,6-dehydratase
MKTALLTGISGQDASYLAELLLDKGWKVIGLLRRSSTDTTARLSRIKLHPNLEIVEGDIVDATGMMKIISSRQPDHIYLLAAQSHVGHSFVTPASTMEIDAMSTIYALEAVRQSSPTSRVYFAGTSELFGDTIESPQNEQTVFSPDSPYAVAKLASFSLVRLYRKAYGIHACSGILFNHTSPRRGLGFITRKVSRYVAALYLARERGEAIAQLQLGNLDARRDWMSAKDAVRGMFMLLSHEKPFDCVFGSGITHSIRDLLKIAFGVISIDNWTSHVAVNDAHKRPQDVGLLLADPSLARRVLGWQLTTTFEEIVAEMVKNDIEELRAEERARVAT